MSEKAEPTQGSGSIVHAFRLSPHQDLKKEILDFAATKKISAGAIVTCVGSLEQVSIRFANQPVSTLLKGHFEIVSLTGTFSESSAHLHIAVSDGGGKTIGGHLMGESFVYTTAEIVILELTGIAFDRHVDPITGYKELVVKRLLQ